jgi:hypothetical protein
MAEEIKENSPEAENNSEKNQKKDFYIEILLMLILGTLIGVAVKTEAAKRITIGSDDYKMKFLANAYNLNNLEKELAKNQAEAQAVETANLQAVPANEAPAIAN